MRFIDSELGTDKVKRGIAIGLVGVSGEIPTALVFLLLKKTAINWTYVSAILAWNAALLAYIAYKFRRLARAGSMRISPLLVLVITCCAQISNASASVAFGGNTGAFRVNMIVPIAFMGAVGGLSMNVITWVLTMGLGVWVSSAAGYTGKDLAAIIIVYATISAVVQGMVAMAVRSGLGRERLRSRLQEINETSMRAETVDAGLQECLPLVSGIMSTDHIVAFISDAAGPGYSIKAAWPSVEPGDNHLCEIEEFAAAASKKGTTVGPLYCVVPIGFIGQGDLFLVMRRSTEKDRFFLSGVKEDFSADTADAIASAFLRMVNRVALISSQLIRSGVDPLTGLASRETLEDRLKTEMSRAVRMNSNLSVATLEVDYMAEFTIKNGKMASDELLKQVADFMSEHVRNHDFLVRYGTEQFAVLFADTGAEGAFSMVDRLRSSFKSRAEKAEVSLSAGVATWDFSESSASLLQRSDSALLQAKAQGRNQVVGASFMSI